MDWQKDWKKERIEECVHFLQELMVEREQKENVFEVAAKQTTICSSCDYRYNCRPFSASHSGGCSFYVRDQNVG